MRVGQDGDYFLRQGFFLVDFWPFLQSFSCLAGAAEGLPPLSLPPDLAGGVAVCEVGVQLIIAPLHALRPARKSAATCAYALFGAETPCPPAVSRPLCQPPPSVTPFASLPLRYFSSASRKSCTLVTD